MNCADLLVLVADATLPQQRPDGSMPPGHNGPYRHPETPVRNSGHWLHTFIKAFSLTGERRFEDAARRIAEYLLRPELRPGGFTFHHRTTPNRDRCNGLVGQAWTIESLALASSHFHSPDHAALALKVYRAHGFDAGTGLWTIREIDGSSPGFDPTLNHQLWFAAAASKLLNTGASDVAEALPIFLRRLPSHMRVFSNGLIFHPIVHLQSARQRVKEIGSRVAGGELFPRSLLRHPAVANLTYQYLKSVGYHAFCAHALATLKPRTASHALWRSATLDRVARYLLSPEYAWLIEHESRYGFAYNAPGFELPWAVATLTNTADGETSALASAWMAAQLRRTYSWDTKAFDRGTADPVTLTARIYEMTGISDGVLTAAELPAQG